MAVNLVIAGMGGSSAKAKKQRAPYGSKKTKEVAPKKRRKMSAAARKAIGDAQRARWAKAKAKAK